MKNSEEEDDLFPFLTIARDPFSTKNLRSCNFMGSFIGELYKGSLELLIAISNGIVCLELYSKWMVMVQSLSLAYLVRPYYLILFHM
mgnify:CR=1 FL=1